MRYCPICDKRYDDESIKFCTIDGTPLVDVEQPSFTALPDKNEPDEDTVIRRNPAAGTDRGSRQEPERIVIPTTPADQAARQRGARAYYEPPPQPNTGKIVALTIVGTLIVLSFGAGLFWLFQKEPPSNININTNPFNVNTNLNTNLGFDSNFNFNAAPNTNYASNYNFNATFNTNLKTLTPTPAPRPSPIISPSPIMPTSPTPFPTPRPTANTRPTILPTARTTPPGLPTNRP